jgi:hypothetical protein
MKQTKEFSQGIYSQKGEEVPNPEEGQNGEVEEPSPPLFWERS